MWPYLQLLLVIWSIVGFWILMEGCEYVYRWSTKQMIFAICVAGPLAWGWILLPIIGLIILWLWKKLG
jgi:hypothetical protein